MVHGAKADSDSVRISAAGIDRNRQLDGSADQRLKTNIRKCEDHRAISC